MVILGVTPQLHDTYNDKTPMRSSFAIDRSQRNTHPLYEQWQPLPSLGHNQHACHLSFIFSQVYSITSVFLSLASIFVRVGFYGQSKEQ